MIRNFLVLIALTCVIKLNAQFKIGVVTGINWSEITGHSIDNNRKFGLNLGLISELKFSRIGVEVDLLFSQKGAGFESSKISKTNNSIDNSNLNLSYFDIPLVAKYYSKNISGLSYQGGVNYSILSQACLNGEKIKSDNFNKNDLAAIIGIGFGSPRIYCFVRHYFGLKEIYSSGDKGKNRSLMISIGYWVKN